MTSWGSPHCEKGDLEKVKDALKKATSPRENKFTKKRKLRNIADWNKLMREIDEPVIARPKIL